MNALAEILANARATSRLKPKYHRATSVVGVLAAFAGIALMGVAAVVFAAVLDLDLGAPVRESNVGLVWVVLFFAAMPFCFFFAMVPVAWLCSSVFVRIGYMSQADRKYYALRSRYPVHWYQEGSQQPVGVERNAA